MESSEAEVAADGELLRLTMDFLTDPGDSSFEEVYMLIWKKLESKIDLKPTIIEVINWLLSFTGEGPTEVEMFYSKIMNYCQKVQLFSSLYIYYDSIAEDNEKIEAMALNAIHTKYFLQDSVISVLQKCASEGFYEFLRKGSEITEPFSKVSKFIFIISPDLYVKVFNRTFTSELGLFFDQYEFKAPVPDIIVELYDMYMRIHDGINETLNQSTLLLFNEFFSSRVVQPEIPSITSEQTIRIIFSSASDEVIFGQLFTLLSLGPNDWKQKMFNNFQKVLRQTLSEIQEPDFTKYCEHITDVLDNAIGISKNCFNSEPTNSFRNVFSRVLAEHRFGNRLCAFYNATPAPLPAAGPLYQFLANDPDFETMYCTYLAQRLLMHGTDVEAEAALLGAFREQRVVLDRAERMLRELRAAPTVDGTMDGAAVHLVVLNTFEWPVLKQCSFHPPQLFVDAFNSAVASLDGVLEYGVARRQFRISESCSTVEFSNGDAKFELSFTYACIVQTLLEGGPMPASELAARLRMNPGELRKHLAVLAECAITREDGDGRVAFHGPPTHAAARFEDEEEQPRKLVEPIFTNCDEQVDAAIVRFLKTHSAADIQEISAFALKELERFSVTQEMIESSLVRLKNNEHITSSGNVVVRYRLHK